MKGSHRDARGRSEIALPGHQPEVFLFKALSYRHIHSSFFFTQRTNVRIIVFCYVNWKIAMLSKPTRTRNRRSPTGCTAKTIALRLDVAERERFEIMASASNKSLSNFARDCVLLAFTVLAAND
ncbi:hypothetical protein FNU76_23945 [Chitinimonas arctica]|uniref:Uncharacterized protein n=1 Tax=Chitinimonas arctica TaxID=2594795 RepID=A0A516SLW6_9NEIS|nr:hypothetical protein [Chitinimonas arctica]QDQ24853.1 hypothetical protein FNU76_00015 [Chitinimonas arctica]QDQ27682.1 hypothetical protein FNU76_15730 [Chitinimonas arctica]QDQ29157.1 hypothetical protein FNU76_23945 [Chitinimonas arctica]